MLKAFLRKLRGVLGTGLTWSVAWSVAGTVLQSGLALLGLSRAPDLMVAPLMWGLMGLYGGSMFGVLMSIAESRRTLEKLRVGRVAIWGAIAGIAVPIVYSVLRGDPSWMSLSFLVTGPLIVAPLSAASAGGMTALAQRGAAERLGSGEEAPGLPDHTDAVELLN